MSLTGNKLAGDNPRTERVKNDFYATDPKAVKAILTNYCFDANTILEPCVGQGHIANTINEFYINKREITGLDLVDRGYPDTIKDGFYSWEREKLKWDYLNLKLQTEKQKVLTRLILGLWSGHEDGALHACCGHGVEKGIIVYPDKTVEINGD